MRLTSVLLLVTLLTGCKNNSTANTKRPSSATVATTNPQDTLIPNTAKVIHVFVALCDNKNQGIVPVPASIGNGQNAATNLYWGCAGGVKGFFKKSASWNLVVTIKDPATNILERCVFKHNEQNAWLVADAYDGAAIKQCTLDFLTAAAGGNNQQFKTGNTALGIGGSANLISYIGHDGLMEFSLHDVYPGKKNDAKRETIILACISKNYFYSGIQKAGATPLLWSTGLMSPEAYTLEAAIAGWLKQESARQIRTRAAQEYDKYQHCGVKAASRLLVTGW